jgi:hypothetical protein
MCAIDGYATWKSKFISPRRQILISLKISSGQELPDLHSAEKIAESGDKWQSG